jgi:hypothetical protein
MLFFHGKFRNRTADHPAENGTATDPLIQGKFFSEKSHSGKQRQDHGRLAEQEYDPVMSFFHGILQQHRTPRIEDSCRDQDRTQNSPGSLTDDPVPDNEQKGQQTGTGGIAEEICSDIQIEPGTETVGDSAKTPDTACQHCQ